jgi:Secretion system C-terminal sorting domain
MKRKILLLTLAIPVILGQNVVAQTSSRLVGEAHWSNNGASFIPNDSSSFSYSSNRGGDLTHPLKYDASYTWYYDTAYHNAYYYTQTFDGNNNITGRITQFWNGTAWQLLSNTLFTYNSSNEMTTMIQQSWNGSAWTPVAQDVYSYNVAGKLVIDQYQVWNSLTSTFEASTQRTYYYDASNNKINETDQSYSGGVPIYTNQWAYTYSSTNQMLTTTYSVWNGAGWTPSTLTTNTYDTLGNKISQMGQVWDGVSSAWVNNTLDIYSSFTGGHQPQMDIHQTWNSAGSGTWVNAMQYTNTYNSYNQLTSSTGQSWNIVGVFEFALGDPMSNYYYQTYSTVTEVKNISNVGGDVTVYPVPAQGDLNVDLNWNEAQAATITIYNAQGSVVRQWSTPVAARFHSTVSVDNLAEGTYFLKINGAQGQIVKQLVVAH